MPAGRQGSAFHNIVLPVKAGIQSVRRLPTLDSRFRGKDKGGGMVALHLRTSKEKAPPDRSGGASSSPNGKRQPAACPASAASRSSAPTFVTLFTGFPAAPAAPLSG